MLFDDIEYTLAVCIISCVALAECCTILDMSVRDGTGHSRNLLRSFDHVWTSLWCLKGLAGGVLVA